MMGGGGYLWFHVLSGGWVSVAVRISGPKSLLGVRVCMGVGTHPSRPHMGQKGEVGTQSP